MVRANGVGNRVQKNQQKEENMNARKVVSVVCVLVVGLLLLQSVALAGGPGRRDRLGEVPLYGPEGPPVAPKVQVPQYQSGDSKVPGFLRGSGSAKKAAPKVDWLWKYPLDNNVAPSVKVPQYYWNGPLPRY
jgi:nitrate reductase NapE component